MFKFEFICILVSRELEIFRFFFIEVCFDEYFKNNNYKNYFLVNENYVLNFISGYDVFYIMIMLGLIYY